MKKQGAGNRDQGTGTTRVRRVLMLGALCAWGMQGPAQQIQFGTGETAAAAKKQHVMLLSDALNVTAGSPQTVELQFRVEPGFHINSHMPKDETLIPTALKLDEGMKVLAEEYPAGSAFRLKIGVETETLDVYQGEFRVKLRVVVPRGTSTMTGVLRYQACDNAACFPPRSLPVNVVVTGK